MGYCGEPNNLKSFKHARLTKLLNVIVAGAEKLLSSISKFETAL